MQNNEYIKHGYNLLTKSKLYEIKKINNNETNMVVMNVVKNNAGSFKSSKET